MLRRFKHYVKRCARFAYVFWYWKKYYYFLERRNPFLYQAVIFINGSVMYYLKCYDILIEPLSSFCSYCDLFEREYLCKTCPLWFYFRTMIRLTRSVCICRDKNKVIIYWQFSEKVSFTYVEAVWLLENVLFLCSVWYRSRSGLFVWTEKLIHQSWYWNLEHCYRLVPVMYDLKLLYHSM